MFFKELKIKITKAMFLLLSARLPIVVVFSWTVPLFGKPDEWFQRAGSIVTMLSLFVEIYIIKRQQKAEDELYKILNKYYLHDDKRNKLYKEINQRIFSPSDRLAFFTLAFTTVVGTLVWGYGDLMYNAVN